MATKWRRDVMHLYDYLMASFWSVDGRLRMVIEDPPLDS
jgi:hypothetical protein